jgi:hypothetical protein
MPVMNVNLVLDDATYAGVKAGIYELGGLVKNADNKRVKKHLPTVVDATKEGAAKAIDMIREHKKGLLVIGGVLIVGGAVAGAVTYISQKEKIKAKKKFGETLEVYLNAAKEGTLTSNLIDDLLASIEIVSKFSKDGAVPINLTSKQLYSLFNSIYDFTKRMADANNVTTKGIKAPSKLSKSKILDLQNYLVMQKQILDNAA